MGEIQYLLTNRSIFTSKFNWADRVITAYHRLYTPLLDLEATKFIVTYIPVYKSTFFVIKRKYKNSPRVIHRTQNRKKLINENKTENLYSVRQCNPVNLTSKCFVCVLACSFHAYGMISLSSRPPWNTVILTNVWG